ncbi:MAG TPA: diaminopimelate decarboxylase [Firmicutes bacterium]|jgi:diaminopimelate decarboxylase|nr:diaminopimelate decarboxylase [Bacillota bacterium]
MHLYGTMAINAAGHLEIGGCDCTELAQHFGTPLYVLDESEFRHRCRILRDSLAKECPGSEVVFAGKSLLVAALCRILAQENLGLDVVSGGELYTALQSGFPAHRIFMHGNNKSQSELRMALESGVGRIVVDNFLELDQLAQLARAQHRTADILLRVTPGIEAHTHAYVKTGQVDSKFGFTMENGQALAAAKRALSLPNINLMGFHCHIGSQIFELEPFQDAAVALAELVAQTRDLTGQVLPELDLGGGFGIRYHDQERPPALDGYASAIRAGLSQACAKHSLPFPRVIIEPGRAISGEAGTTLYSVGSIKEIPAVRTYLSVDGGMGDNPRTALYGAKYSALIANRADQEPDTLVSVAGKYCESGDMLIWDVQLAAPRPGDILAVFCTGAYNYSMASNYNRLPRPAMVLVCDGEADLIVRRETYADVMANDIIPKRLAPENKACRAG